MHERINVKWWRIQREKIKVNKKREENMIRPRGKWLSFCFTTGRSDIFISHSLVNYVYPWARSLFLKKKGEFYGSKIVIL